VDELENQEGVGWREMTESVGLEGEREQICFPLTRDTLELGSLLQGTQACSPQLAEVVMTIFGEQVNLQQQDELDPLVSQKMLVMVEALQANQEMKDAKHAEMAPFSRGFLGSLILNSPSTKKYTKNIAKKTKKTQINKKTTTTRLEPKMIWMLGH
jgi:hypothetical protein